MPWKVGLLRRAAVAGHFVSSYCLLCGAVSCAQAPPTNWLLPVKIGIVRDPQALVIIQSSLSAMNPQDLPLVSDQLLQASVNKWAGSATTGSLTEISIGTFAQSIAVTVGGQTVLHSLRTSDSKTDQSANGKSVMVNDARVFEQIPLLPPLLLQEALNNTQEAVEMLSDDPANPGQSHLRMTVRPSFWQPSMRDSASASFDLFIARDTSLLAKVTGVRHYDGSLRHYFSTETLFTRYSLDGGRMLPHVIEQREMGRSMTVLSINSISINQGFKLSNLK